jgi:ribosomal protein S18 acetylase RimI-like enzyme
MSYNHRLATNDDRNAIAIMLKIVYQEWAELDRAVTLKPDLDIETHVASLLAKPHTYCILLEDNEANSKIIGCLITQYYDESCPSVLTEYEATQHENTRAFMPRRVCTVLGLYIDPAYRDRPTAIQHLIDAGIEQTDRIGVNAIDLGVLANLTAFHKLLERNGFRQATVQYTMPREIACDRKLVSLHEPTFSNSDGIPIPLIDPKTNQQIKNPAGEIVFLYPLQDETGNTLRSSQGKAIYPCPINDPETQAWLFQPDGKLAVCPVVCDRNGQIVEQNGIPQFYLPDYQLINGKLQLKTNPDGSYVFKHS